MSSPTNSVVDLVANYRGDLVKALQAELPEHITTLFESLKSCWQSNKTIYVCGNGGSAANAVHIANDLMYVDGALGAAMRVESLTANSAIVTCVANDFSYDDIFCKQLEVKAEPGDLLLALSGSGNSSNIIKAIEYGNRIGMETFAILGFGGGQCMELAKYPIHFPVDDMQISEDLQLIVGHLCMRFLKSECSQVEA